MSDVTPGMVTAIVGVTLVLAGMVTPAASVALLSVA